MHGREEVRHAGFAALGDRDVPALVERRRLFSKHGVDLVTCRAEPVVHRCVVLDELRDQWGFGDVVEERAAKVHAAAHLGRPRRAVPEEIARVLLAGDAVEQKEVVVCVWSSLIFTVFF